MALTAPARASTLSVQVAHQLEQLITSGEWPVGTRIPAESELCSRLGVSRNTVREALRSLVHMGMLEALVGDGTYVRAFSELEAPLVRRARRASPAEAVELRSVLERAAAGLAARRRTARDSAQLRRCMLELRQAARTGDRSAYAQADLALHQAVVRCAGNALLTEVYEHLGGALKLSVRPELWDRTLAVDELPLHEQLVDAIVQGRPALAETRAAELIETLRAALLPPKARASRAGRD